MISRIYSDLLKFKNLEFRPGFNVLLAEKSSEATDKHTRNRAGKSSLLDIIHFLLGSNRGNNTIFQKELLKKATFGMEFDLGDSLIRIERIGEQPTPLKVFGDTTKWPIQPIEKGENGLISNNNWRTVLGKIMFGIDEFEGNWGPSFRSLIKYFVRRDREGGMEYPVINSRDQQPVDQQVNLSFLMGLDWAISREWQQVRDREAILKKLKKGMENGAFGEVIGSASSLKSKLIVAKDRVKKLKEAVVSFKVIEQYHELEHEASRLTRRLSEFADENVIDKRYRDELEAAVNSEIPPVSDDIYALYKEAGVLLPEIVQKRFEKVSAFHESVIKNRKSYLESERAAVERRIDNRNKEMVKADNRRFEVMNILNSSGALDHFVALQAELSKAEATHEALKQRYETAEHLETGGIKLKVERATLLERLHRDLEEQSEIVEEAVLTFREISSHLYEGDKAGTLTISPTDNGPVFDPHISGELSKGVNNMRIFCFDFTLMLLSLRRGQSPGFLIHESHLFDGVDERQVGKALAVGAGLAEKHNFQYIITMNNDDVPKEIPTKFHIEDYVLDVRLTDASEDGGLFGFRFD